MPTAERADIPSSEQSGASKTARGRIAMFASVDSFEGFYGGTFGLDRKTYVTTYRNDFLWEYAEGLRQLGHEVFIYFRSYGPTEVAKAADGLYVRFLHLPSWSRIVDALLFRARNLAHVPAVRERIAYIGYGAEFQRALKEDGIEVVYHQEIWTPRFDLIVERTPVPVLGADQGAPYADWMAAAKTRSLPRAAGVLCQSHTGLARVRELGAAGQLLYNGVDIDFFRPGEADQLREKHVLAVGRLVEQQKRFSDLLLAMQALPDFRLTLVGSGPDEKKLRALAETLGVSSRVHFAGFITDREQLRSLYQQCGAFVSTSSWEALALVMLEAMSCGAPVVATDIPSFKDLLTDGKDGLLVPVGAIDKIAAAIQRAFAERDDLGSHARETVSTRFSSRALYGQLSAIIQAI